MTPRSTPIRARFARLLAVGALAVAAPLAVAGCSGEAGSTQCSTTECTVTLKRGVDAKATVLGLEVQFVRATDSEVTVKVAGTEVTIPVGASAGAGGATVGVQSLTKDEVVLKISLGQ